MRKQRAVTTLAWMNGGMLLLTCYIVRRCLLFLTFRNAMATTLQHAPY